MHPAEIDTDNPRKSRDLRRLFALKQYLRPRRWLLAGVLVSLVIAALSVLALGFGIRLMVDQGFVTGDTSRFHNALWVLLATVVVMATATFCRFYLITRVGELVIADIRSDVYRHLLKLSPAFFEHTGAGAIVSRFTSDTTVLQGVVGSSLSIALRSLLLLIGGIGMLVFTSLKLSLYMAVMIPLVVVPILVLGRKVRKLSKQSQDKVALLAGQLEESISAIRTVQAYGRETYEAGRFISKIEDSLVTASERIKLRAFLSATIITLAFGSIIFVLWMGGHDVMNDTLSSGELASFLFYSIIVAGALGSISDVIGDINRAAGAMESLLELMETPADIKAPEFPVALPKELKGEVRFNGVAFSYPTRPNAPALKGISFYAKAGEKIAIVGPSGAGKTTIFQLLLRFYDPQSGSISIDGLDVRSLIPEDVRRHIAVVSQDPFVFSATVEENIRYGRMDASDEEIVNAAKAARVFDFIERLPNGFKTHVGEKGVRLSGGERQRIAIARAILKKPKILLLDEATSALDSENESLVQEALDHLMQQCTTLVIAHRLSTVQNMERILVMNEGAIDSSGTHAELLAKKGLYAKLAEMQFRS